LQLLQHYATHPQGKIVSKGGSFFCLITKRIRLEDDGFGRLDRPRTELPLVRRKKPGPTERLASAERLNRNEAFSRNVCCFQSDFTAMNQIKMLRIIAFLKNLLAGPEALNDSAFNQQRKVLRQKVIPKRMPGENIFESVHRYFTNFPFSNLARKSEVRLPRESADTFRFLEITLEAAGIHEKSSGPWLGQRGQQPRSGKPHEAFGEANARGGTRRTRLEFGQRQRDFAFAARPWGRTAELSARSVVYERLLL
jgi:hypothetical protein